MSGMKKLKLDLKQTATDLGSSTGVKIETDGTDDEEVGEYKHMRDDSSDNDPNLPSISEDEDHHDMRHIQKEREEQSE